MRKEKKKELEKIINSFKTISFNRLNIPSKFITSETYSCVLNNGKTIIREKLIKQGKDGSAAIILPVTKDNNVILTVEPRVFTKETVGVGLPSGYVEQDEETYLAALRELEEETGYIPDDLIYLGGFYQDMGCSSAYNKSYLALGCQKLKDQKLDAGEYIKYFDCLYEEALELIDLGYIKGCNAIITLNKARKYLKK